MKLIAGLGNYPEKYRFTRHNIGYDFIEYFRENNFLSQNYENANLSEFFQIKYAREDIIFVRPHTYMNLSGDCILKFCSKMQIKPENILIIHDDLDIEFGKLKIGFNKGDGGHNGISSVISNIGKKFYRLRVGIFSETFRIENKTDYVLDRFTEENMKIIGKNLYPDIEEIVKIFMKGNIVHAINKFNSVRRAKNE
ncbi:MAG: aminoacyl-tRNA hydrolase [Candidatus Muirbacterium halophilum]|nr:aminoacyl-tRNA hydrolase [Candidatus Muirbacterium halophilum]MCK9474789.1 aminoacyl-tRNA hydrolase [Candidatus Muirbacterium halophilum]